MADILLEVCVDSAAGLQAAVDGGADRIELCSALDLGGLTPGFGLMKLAARAPVPVHLMIRPRSGGFVHDEADVATMLHDIDMARDLGLAGVVLGALTPDSTLDAPLLARFCRHAEGLDLTLHRAFDCCGPDFGSALETAVSLGFHRILTSGGRATAIEGLPVLERLFAKAGQRITIMPGSGVTPDTIGTLQKRLPLSEVHASCSIARAAPDDAARRLGFAGKSIKQTSADRVRALKAALASA